ncbi:MAG: hypothetical protein HC933_05580, partial [Pleurocapsa sp. SU_196_0]|nr:hypothetical protein [Pleurocapsa sp. SU_196_0]
PPGRPRRERARAAFLGYRDAEATITLRLGTKLEFEAFQSALELFRTPKNSKSGPKVCPVAHPQFALHQIKSVYIYDFSAPDYVNGEYVVTLSAREYTLEAFKVSKVTTTDQKAKGGKDADLAQSGAANAAGNKSKPPRGSPPAGPAQASPNRFLQRAGEGVALGSGVGNGFFGSGVAIKP